IAEFRGGNGIRVCSGALPDERRTVRSCLVLEIATGFLSIHRQERKGIPGCSDRRHVPGDFQLERVYVRGVIPMDIPRLFATPSASSTTRREFLRRAGSGCGLLALAGLLNDQHLLAAEAVSSETSLANSALRTPTSALNPLNPLAAHPGHFPAKAKSVI